MEELLGTAFVVCQAYATSVVSRVFGLLRYARRQGLPLTSIPNDRRGMLRTANSLCGRTGYTEVEVLDAFANYFKHRFEWPSTDWSRASGRASETIAIVKAAGAGEGSTGNLRTGAEVLGNADYSELSCFSAILEDWRGGLVDLITQELNGTRLPLQ